MRRLVLLVLVAACGGGARKAAHESMLPPAAAAPPAATAEAAPAAPEKDPWAGRTDLIVPPPPAKAAPVNLPKVERFTLPDGMRVLVVASRDLPVVSMHLAVDAGNEDEPRDRRMLADYAAQMLTKGTARHSADEIAAAMDFVGGRLNASADLEATHVTCSVLAKDLATCLTLLAEVVVTPTFPQEEMKQASEQLIAGLRAIRDNPEALAQEHFDNLLWGEDHVRGWARSIEAVQAVTRKDLVSWHGGRFVPQTAMLAVAGDVDVAQLRADLGKVFAGWKKRKAPAARSWPEPKWKGMKVRLVDNPDLTQSNIVVGHLGISHRDKDYLPTVLLNYVLGGGSFSSRLMTVVRVKGGKSYGAHSDFERWRTRGAFVATTATRNVETLATLRMILGEMERMRAEGPTAEELAAAKANLAGGYALHFQGPDDVAGAVLAAELHGLGEDYVREYPVRIDAVTLEDVRATAKKRLDPQDVAVVIVGKADDVAPLLDGAAIAYERVGYLEAISARERQVHRPPAPAALDPRKTAAGKKLLDAALAAKGGEAKLRGVKDLVARGTVKLALGDQTVEGTWQRVLVTPDRMSVSVDLRGVAELQMVITPDGVFQTMNKTAVKDLPKDLADDARDGIWRDHDMLLLRHLDPSTQVQDAGKTTVAGKAYDTVVLRRADGSNETRVLLDPQTHMLFRVMYREGAAPGLEEYGDYRSVDGIQMAHKQHAEGAQGNIDVVVTEFKVNGGVPAGAFDRPKQP